MPCYYKLFRYFRVTCGKNSQDSRELSFNIKNQPNEARTFQTPPQIKVPPTIQA